MSMLPKSKMAESKYKKFFTWGVLNGLTLGIFITDKIDISQDGLMAQILNSFKPLLEQSGISTFWLSFIIFIIGFVGLVSLILEIKSIYDKGAMAITFAVLGFLGILLLLLKIDFGIWFLIGAGILFATEQYWG